LAYDDCDTAHAVLLARPRPGLSCSRQGEGRIRSFGIDAGPSAFAPPQPPGYAQLVTIRSGVARLSCGNARIALPRGHAVWIPDGSAYAVELHARSELRVVYADARHFERAFEPVATPPLLDELIERATRSGYLDPSNARAARLIAVIEDELRALARDDAANALVFPRDPALLAAVAPAPIFDRVPSIATLAAAARMSVRTFERRWKSETGLAPCVWLRRARLGEAAIALACGASVTEAALASGYSSLSAFIAAYRFVFGITPGRASRQQPALA
jgi:AraC-like DNA-binding protein